MESPPQSNRPVVVVLSVLAVVACLCLCVAGLAGGGAYLVTQVNSVVTQIASQVVPVLTQSSEQSTPSPVPNLNLTPLPTPVAGVSDTLQTLDDAVIPPSDLRLEAMRLKGIGNIPEVVSSTPANYQVGQELTFNASNQDTNATFQVQAKLIYVTANVYFFAQDGIGADPAAVKKLVDTFQTSIYPTDRAFFGSEWNPGVDGDPHLYILFAGGLGSSVAGYYSSADEYSHLAQPYSNEKEMFYVNADNQRPGDPYLLGVLAHEFQHMIHWNHDRNEETWLNEGSSVLAEFLNHYDIGGFDAAYTSNSDLQLDGWSETPSTDPTISAHYGAGFLFMDYFLDRFGSDATKALVADPLHGMRSVDDVLTKLAITDATTHKPITSVDLFADWTIANYLGDAKVADGRYAYHNYPQAPKVPSPTNTYSTCPVQATASVHQFGANYYEIDCTGKLNITFTGSQQVQVIPARPYGGRYAFWGARNDASDTRLTHAFDLTGLTTATLTYEAWWELEKDYDFTYLEVSTDGGTHWTIVKTPSGTGTNPTGNNFGWGYTGNSGGGSQGQWIKESVDLSAYAGKKIMLRFEYITDAAVTWSGFMVDDISIPELSYATDFEKDDGGWVPEGFVRMDDLLPQEFVVQVITEGAQTTVQRMTIDAHDQGSLPVTLGPNDKAVLVVSGVTPFTTQLATYQFAVK